MSTYHLDRPLCNSIIIITQGLHVAEIDNNKKIASSDHSWTLKYLLILRRHAALR